MLENVVESNGANHKFGRGRGQNDYHGGKGRWGFFKKKNLHIVARIVTLWMFVIGSTIIQQVRGIEEEVLMPKMLDLIFKKTMDKWR